MLRTKVSGWIWLYYALSLIAIGGIIANLGYYSWQLIKPTNAGGIMFAGGFDFLVALIRWAIAAIGLLLAIVLRLPGYRLAWIAAGVFPVVMGTWWYFNYPDNALGNLLLSPTPEDISRDILLGALLLLSVIFIPKRKKPPSGVRLIVQLKTVVAGVFIALFLGLPLYLALREPLPDCAHDKDGRQLTMCIGANALPTTLVPG
ncbi:hypothetical protein [Pseudomonas purpurea]|uniref:hypothetical protein n=1 Tax=Pseudomonas purpurea TaxID=3136737 RepID=UPI003264BEBD